MNFYVNFPMHFMVKFPDILIRIYEFFCEILFKYVSRDAVRESTEINIHFYIMFKKEALFRSCDINNHHKSE